MNHEHLECIGEDLAGIAQGGIQTLRCTVEAATEAGCDHIINADLEVGRTRAKRAIREANLRSLSFRYQVLNAVIHKTGEVNSSAIYEHYDAVADRVWECQSEAAVATDDPRPSQEAAHLQSDRESRHCLPTDPTLEPTCEDVTSEATLRRQ